MLQEDEKAPAAKEHSRETGEREGQTRTTEEKPREASVHTQNHTAVTAATAAPSEGSQLDSGEKANGILEVMQDGFGFIRCENFLPEITISMSLHPRSADLT